MNETMNEVKEMMEVATEVVAGNDGTEIVQTFDIPDAVVVTEKSGKSGKIAVGVGAAALAVGGLIYGGVKLVKHFRKKKLDRDFEEGYYEEDVDVEPYEEDGYEGGDDQEPVQEK